MPNDAAPIVPADNMAASLPSSAANASANVSGHHSAAMHGRGRGYSGSSSRNPPTTALMRNGSASGSGNGNGQQMVPESPTISSNNSSPMCVWRRDGKKFIGCSPFDDYELTTKLGEGTFGEVHKAIHKSTGTLVALKRVLMHNEKEGLPITAIREIKLLKSLTHPNIVPLSDMLVRHEGAGSTQAPSVYMVFPYMEHDLTGLLENPKIHLRLEHIKLYLRQLLEGTAYLHASHVMHRDMKASNLLLNNAGCLYIADFGLARSFNPDERKDMTKCVVTRWYRPPELLLGERKYTTAIDMWGIGCIFAEMLVGKPVFQGNSDLNQIDQVMRICGSPTTASWPGWRDLPDCNQVVEFATYARHVREEFVRFGEDAADLLDQLLQLDPKRRPDAAIALKHRIFFTAPFPARPEDMPKFEHSHEFDRRKIRHQQRAQQQQQQQALPPQAPSHHQSTQQHHQQQQRQSGHHQSQYSSPPNRRDSNRYVRREEPYGTATNGANNGRAPPVTRNDGGWESNAAGPYRGGDARRGNAGYANAGNRNSTAAPRSGYHPYPRGNNGASGGAGGRGGHGHPPHNTNTNNGNRNDGGWR